MEKLGRKVVAYHPEIRVRRGDRIVVIQADMDDFYEDGEVLGMMAAANPDCRTVGQLVEAVEGELFRRSPSILACCISVVEATAQDAEAPCRDWDEAI